MNYVRIAAMLALTFTLIGGCGSETTSHEAELQPCQPGEVRNPISNACTSSNSATTDAGSDSGANREDTGSSGSPDVAVTVDTGSSGGKDAGSGTDAGDSPDPSEFVRFVAIGDVGEGNDMQRKVGQSIGVVCEALGGCHFGLLLGDNVYNSGVSSVDDVLFDTMFAVPYGHLPFHFYVVLGNHDLGGDGIGVDLDPNKGTYQVEYSQRNPQWVMPDEHYQTSVGPVWLAALNTTDVFFDQAEDQEQAVQDWMPLSGDRWRIAFGHHPYISNGKHGNAGEYEGAPFLPVVNGKAVKDFMEDFVCGKFDLYIAGHDHSRQDLVATCGTEFVVSGAGAKTTELRGSNPVHFEADTEGFALFEAWPDKMKIHFYDADGALEHSRTITR